MLREIENKESQKIEKLSEKSIVAAALKKAVQLKNLKEREID
jgi:hypothetical protein